jgi:hypothetical protein
LYEKRHWLKALHEAYLQQPWYLKYDTTTSPRCFLLLPWPGTATGKHPPIGWINHTITALWYGYDVALMAYINAHIDVWVGRGYKNTMTRYLVPDEYPRPPWTFSVEMHLNHKQALLAKEYGENRRGVPEPPWYQLLPEFVGVVPKIDYNWWPDGSRPR